MDRICEIIGKITEDSSVQAAKGKFTSSFLNQPAGVYEKYGFGMTKDFLWDKAGRGEDEEEDLRVQAEAVLRVLEIFKDYPEVLHNRKIGRYLIKTLRVIAERGLKDVYC